jgi:hypothetical protein
MRALYLYDPDAHAAENAADRPHWPAYTPLMLEPIGLNVAPISPAALAAGGWEADTAVLLVPDAVSVDVPNTARWLERGGILIGWPSSSQADLGLGPQMRRVFGVEAAGPVIQQPGDFEVGAQITLLVHPLTAGVASPLDPHQPLLTFSDALPLSTQSAEPLARFLVGDSGEPGGAAITARRVGAGWAFYFGFDVAKTIRVLHHGRPVDRDYDGDGLLRLSDAIVTRGHSTLVPYADVLLFLLRNMLACRPLPLISPLPPQDGRPSDVLFFYGGDDECDPGMAVAASRWMRQRGLPYHANLMPRNGRFAVTADEAAEMTAAGHEISLHFNFMDGFEPGAGFTAEDIEVQLRHYEATFGHRPVCTVNHCCRWCGWVEPARWMAEAGVRADNTRIHRGSPPLNPVNELGFAFGTAFPFWFCDDASGGDRRLDILCEPITAYEVGYRSSISGSAPPEDPEQTDLARVGQAIDIASHYHLTMNMFYHPVYIARSPACRAAIDELLRQIEERGLRAHHMGNDALYRWWEARSRSCVNGWEAMTSGIRFQAHCVATRGMVVQIPVPESSRGHSENHTEPLRTTVEQGASVDGQSASAEIRFEFGRTWLWLVVPEGEHEVEVDWSRLQ